MNRFRRFLKTGIISSLVAYIIVVLLTVLVARSAQIARSTVNSFIMGASVFFLLDLISSIYHSSAKNFPEYREKLEDMKYEGSDERLKSLRQDAAYRSFFISLGLKLVVFTGGFLLLVFKKPFIPEPVIFSLGLLSVFEYLVYRIFLKRNMDKY